MLVFAINDRIKRYFIERNEGFRIPAAREAHIWRSACSGELPVAATEISNISARCKEKSEKTVCERVTARLIRSLWV